MSSTAIRRSARMPLVAVVVALTGLVGLASAAPAQAHSALVSSDPTDGQTITTPLDHVGLTFSEAPLTGLDAGLRIEVRDAAGTDRAAGDVTVDGTTMSRTVDLQDGAYTVLWRYVSPDGHPVTGELGFTVALPAQTAAPTASATPTSGPTETSATVEATRSATPAASDAGSGAGGAALWLGAGAVLVAGLVAVLAVARRRRTPSED
ncbi:copper resistance protein CopC [Curtobacterium sp. VKM Ac-2865]|uniref:copper resistance CopC family protein n=1 Tax=Curtobacterium sp. VKM Ac-2865 TaxID=2783817 RepID=UPI00188BD626|nr:copper resistance CopC family protein [Curtobacterium sp. VKM Ac-2865]MBF4581469.1 copper resistance protein CopC [Curtobacterium sp. VKM Ac-2865]